MKQIDKNISGAAYKEFLAEIVNMVQNHRALAVHNVQTVSNRLYWNIGELIIKKQQQYGWGKSIVEQLSRDLNMFIGEGVSWSPRNLWFMRQLAGEYSNLKQPVSEIENLKQLVSEVPWGHNILILQKLKDIKARIFYLQLIDEQLKQSDDHPSIGILLVPHKDRLEVEYALKTASKPIGVAKYTLSKQLPGDLYGKLPSAKDFQQIMN